MTEVPPPGGGSLDSFYFVKEKLKILIFIGSFSHLHF